MKQALIVIDVQESFRQRPYWRGDELPAFLKNVQSLIDQANAPDARNSWRNVIFYVLVDFRNGKIIRFHCN